MEALVQNGGGRRHGPSLENCTRQAVGGPVGKTQNELSPRELAIVEYVRDGRSLKEIAAELGISPNTASTYLCRARQKHGSSSRWRLAALLLGGPTTFATVFGPRYVEFSSEEAALGDQLLQGLSDIEVARLLNISKISASRVIARLLKKAGVSTRTALFARARNLQTRRDDSRPCQA
jgi:DNA-binding NarL/FixJ family response regulator